MNTPETERAALLEHESVGNPEPAEPKADPLRERGRGSGCGFGP